MLLFREVLPLNLLPDTGLSALTDSKEEQNRSTRRKKNQFADPLASSGATYTNPNAPSTDAY